MNSSNNDLTNHSKYSQLRTKPPRLNIIDDAKEVIFTTISKVGSISHLRFRKTTRTSFKIDSMGYPKESWNLNKEFFELEWLADEQCWEDIIIAINQGNKVIEKVNSR